MKMFFTLEYYMYVGNHAEINFYFLSADHDPITILRMDRYFDPVDDDPLEYLQSYSSSNELKAFWEQFSKDELLELLETEGITEYFEFHPWNSPGIISHSSTRDQFDCNLGSLV